MSGGVGGAVGERAARPQAAVPPTAGGWAALLLASLLGGWGAIPILIPGGPDLAALRPPAREAPGAGGAGGSAASLRRAPKTAPAGRLDLNRASAAELAGLPGLGPVLAGRIVAYRQAVGPFPRVEALRGVPGVGPKRYERLAPHLRVRDEGAP